MLYNVLVELYASYPRCVSDSLMNILGTHDTERILTVLGEGGEEVDEEISNAELSVRRLNPYQLEKAVRLLKIAAAVQYTVYGVPSVFYGDEAGLEGYHDPFCRKPFPWGKENTELLGFYKKLGAIRAENAVFADGDFTLEYAEGGFIAYSREKNGEKISIVVNVSDTPCKYDTCGGAVDLLTDTKFNGEVAAESVVILR